MNDFRYALTLANLLYDIHITNEDDAIEIGLIAYNHIGNKSTKLKRELVFVNEGVAELPCDVDVIESVTYPNREDWNRTSNTHLQGDSNSLMVESFIEGNKVLTSPLYNSGKLVKYRQVGDILYIDGYTGMISILYYANTELPLLNDKEALAIADYIAYVYKYKEAIRTNNNNLLQLASLIYQKWSKHCNDARTPIYLSQNDMNDILDVRYSHDRKDYGKSYKPIK